VWAGISHHEIMRPNGWRRCAGGGAAASWRNGNVARIWHLGWLLIINAIVPWWLQCKYSGVIGWRGYYHV